MHEAYVRLVGQDTAQNWNSRGHFFAAAAEAMRRILVDSARRKKAAKRGVREDCRGVEISDIAVIHNPDELLAVHDALEDLAAADPQSAELVKLRYFLGLTVEEASEHLGISPRKSKYAWAYARSWLRDHLEAD